MCITENTKESDTRTFEDETSGNKIEETLVSDRENTELNENENGNGNEKGKGIEFNCENND